MSSLDPCTWHGIQCDVSTNFMKTDLPVNNLSGVIPTAIGRLVMLESLRMNDNKLTGVLLPQLGKLNNLTVLSLSYNQLSGNIPWEISGMNSHEFLGL